MVHHENEVADHMKELVHKLAAVRTRPFHHVVVVVEEGIVAVAEVDRVDM